MKRLFKLFSLLSCIAVFTFCIIGVKQEDVNAPVRDVELSCQSLEVDSSFKEFEDYELQIDEQCVNFIGYNDISLSELEELDLISSDDISDNTTTKYTCMYDYENGIVSLSVSLVSNEEISIIDTMYGVIIMDEEENFDVVFDCEGETLLLSELEESGVLENCGFWSKLKKVWNSTAGKIGTIVTVATCAVVGVVCAVVPGGQLVTAALIGAAVGAIGGATTAMVSTYIQDGKIDWEAVFCYTGAGAVAGVAVSSAFYGITAGIKNAITASKKAVDAGGKTFRTPEKLTEHFEKHAKEFDNLCPTVGDYLDGANYVIENGQYVSELNGYIRFFGANGKANYAFVGMTSDGSAITTFGIRSVSDLAKYIPWLVK